MITSFVFSCVSLFCNIQKKERKIFIPNEPFHVGFRYWWSLNGLCFYLPFSIVKVKRNRQKNPKLSKKTDYQLFGFFFSLTSNFYYFLLMEKQEETNLIWFCLPVVWCTIHLILFVFVFVFVSFFLFFISISEWQQTCNF